MTVSEIQGDNVVDYFMPITILVIFLSLLVHNTTSREGKQITKGADHVGV